MKREPFGRGGRMMFRACAIVVGAGLLVVAGSIASTQPLVAPSLSMRQMLGASAGHPAQDTPTPPVLNPPRDLFGNDTGLPDDFDVPPFSPLESGPYVNFESPPVRPLALSADGATLLATNTPNSSLVVIHTTGIPTILKEIPVGIDPVAVAFQPGTNDQIAWVANHVSDTVSIVNVGTGKVEATLDVGDEPVNILFNAAGSHAFVVIQGSRPYQTYEMNSAALELGNLVVIDTSARAILSYTFLDLHTPRAAVFDAVDNQIVVAALHAGNNTTTVGNSVLMKLNEPPPPNPGPCEQSCNCNCVVTNLLLLMRDFSATAALFAGSPHLGPVYPDVHDDPGFPLASPLVQRIVPDMGRPNAWKSIVELLTDDNGDPDPAMVAAMNAQFNILNADEIIAEIALDGLNTVDHDLAIVDVSNPSNTAGMPIVQHKGNVGSTIRAIALNQANGKLLVANLEPKNLTRHETNLNGQFIEHQVRVLGNWVLPIFQVDAFDLHSAIPNFDDVSQPNPLAQAGSLANPVDLLVDPTRPVAFVAALGPDRVGALNAGNASVLGRVDVGRGPRGLALDAAADRLYVFNRIDMTISVVDVTNPLAMSELRRINLFNPEPPQVVDGRKFLYSTKFSNNFASSCELCHFDGTLDHRAWDLGNPGGPLDVGPPNVVDINGNPIPSHPLKGPMVTLSLQGLKGHEHFHWRGDRTNLQVFNPAFAGLLGGSELEQDEIDAFAAFVDTIVYPPNPYYNRDGSMKDPIHAMPGGVLFLSSCNPCHNIFDDGALTIDGVAEDGGFDIGNIFQTQEVTQLRGIYKKFISDRLTGVGTLHDGQEVSENNGHPLQTFLLTFFGNFTPEMRDDMVAFVTAFQTNVMNVVGWQVHTNGPPSVDGLSTIETDVLVMAAQNAKVPSRCDVIAKGTVGDDQIGYVLIDPNPAAPVFESDLGDTLALSQLLNSLTNVDTLTFTAVPPGSGRRMGVDQDLDCASDGYDGQPQSPNPADGNYDGHVNVVDLLLFVPCFTAGVATTECKPFDTDCDGVISVNDLATFLSLYEAPADCNANGIEDAEEIILGLSHDVDQDGVPDECPTIIAQPVGSRYIKVEVGGDQPVAILVQSPDSLCGALYATAEGRLVDTPLFQLPADWGTLFLGDREIQPSQLYAVSVVSASFQRDTVVSTWKFGDTNNANGANLDDILCVLKAFAGMFDGVCTRQSADLIGPNFTPDRLLTLDDILNVLRAFEGSPYVDGNPCG